MKALLAVLFIGAVLGGWALSSFIPEESIESRIDWGGDENRCFSYMYVDYGHIRQKYKTNLCQV